MKKSKKTKITPEDLINQARNERLPPVSRSVGDDIARLSGVRRSKGRKTIEDAPDVGQEQAP